MASTTKMLRRGSVARKVAIGSLLLRTGAARWALLDVPVILAQGFLAVPNKSGLARVYLSHKASRNGDAARLAALTVAAAGVGAGIGYLAKSLQSS